MAIARAGAPDGRFACPRATAAAWFQSVTRSALAEMGEMSREPNKVAEHRCKLMRVMRASRTCHHSGLGPCTSLCRRAQARHVRTGLCGPQPSSRMIAFICLCRSMPARPSGAPRQHLSRLGANLVVHAVCSNPSGGRESLLTGKRAGKTLKRTGGFPKLQSKISLLQGFKPGVLKLGTGKSFQANRENRLAYFTLTGMVHDERILAHPAVR